MSASDQRPLSNSAIQRPSFQAVPTAPSTSEVTHDAKRFEEQCPGVCSAASWQAHPGVRAFVAGAPSPSVVRPKVHELGAGHLSSQSLPEDLGALRRPLQNGVAPRGVLRDGFSVPARLYVVMLMKLIDRPNESHRTTSHYCN